MYAKASVVTRRKNEEEWEFPLPFPCSAVQDPRDFWRVGSSWAFPYLISEEDKRQIVLPRE